MSTPPTGLTSKTPYRILHPSSAISETGSTRGGHTVTGLPGRQRGPLDLDLSIMAAEENYSEENASENASLNIHSNPMTLDAGES